LTNSAKSTQNDTEPSAGKTGNIDKRSKNRQNVNRTGLTTVLITILDLNSHWIWYNRG